MVSHPPLYVRAAAMCCPVGLKWLPASAAIRAGLSRRQELWYLDNRRRPIVGSALDGLDRRWTSGRRWRHLLSRAVSEAHEALGTPAPPELFVFLALPRGGDQVDMVTLGEQLSDSLGRALDGRRLTVVQAGASGGYEAMAMARDMLETHRDATCLVAGADSLIGARRLLELERQRRLLTEDNPDGVVPGEAATCVALSASKTGALARILGIGVGVEPARLDNDVPLRGDGIVAAALGALDGAGLAMHDISFRVSDASGESFYFKEQALLTSRLLRQRKDDFPLWLCAEQLGDTGAASGLCGLAYALAGFARHYAPGPRAIAFAGDDQGRRSAVVVESRVASP